MNIAIIDYDLGNTASVGRVLEILGYHYKITRQESVLERADCLILPGVGAFNEAMEKLEQYGLVPLLNRLVLQEKKPIIGICLGMQLMATDSYENGYTRGLNWIKGSVVRFSENLGITVPHVGWNNIAHDRSGYFSRLASQPDFYFDHSFHFIASNPLLVKAKVTYGEPVVAMLQDQHIYGIQFHPEKSARNGLRLLRGIMEEIERC